jgi:hypothetical protein
VKPEESIDETWSGPSAFVPSVGMARLNYLMKSGIYYDSLALESWQFKYIDSDSELRIYVILSTMHAGKHCSYEKKWGVSNRRFFGTECFVAEILPE